MPSLICVNPKTTTGHTLLVLCQIKFQHTISLKARREWKVIHWRSGSRPWTCVHAHGHDVDPIMEASCNNNYCLDIISSGICELILCNHGSNHIFYLIPFLKQVKTLVFCGSIPLRNPYVNLPSSNGLQYLENINELCCFLRVFIYYCFSPISDFPWVLSYFTREHR